MPRAPGRTSSAGTTPSRSEFPVVADPLGSDLNQLYLNYDSGDQWQLRVGRQQLLLDNQRFVGPVGWRQNVQTFDALSVSFEAKNDLKASYSYVVNANRIFGDSVPAGDHEQDTHLLNVRYDLLTNWLATAYGYVIDNQDAPAFSTRTFGASLTGSIDVGLGKLAIRGELARQSEGNNAPVDYNAGYGRLDLVLSLTNGIVFGGGFERLDGDSSNPGGSFRTPLATLHPFNGWADKFLTTPDAGLDDAFVTIGYGSEPWKADLIYHEFSAASGSADYGTEIDLAIRRKIGKRYAVLLKFARFNAQSGSTYADTTKAWLMCTADF